MDIITLFLTSSSAVAATIFVTLVGALLVSQLNRGRESIRGISFLSAFVMVPCLLFSHLSEGFTLDLASRGRMALLFGLAQVCAGGCCAFLSNRFGFTPKGYEPLMMLSCITQNAIAYPISLLTSIRGVKWLNGDLENGDFTVWDETLSTMLMLCFAYNVFCSGALWSIGHHMIRSKAAEESSSMTAPKTVSIPTGFVHVARDWFNRNIRPMLSMPFCASLAGIACGLCPWTHWMLYEAPAVPVLTRGIRTVGDAAVPLTMMLMGMSLRRTGQKINSSAAVPKDTSQEIKVRRSPRRKPEITRPRTPKPNSTYVTNQNIKPICYSAPASPLLFAMPHADGICPNVVLDSSTDGSPFVIYFEQTNSICCEGNPKRKKKWFSSPPKKVETESPLAWPQNKESESNGCTDAQKFFWLVAVTRFLLMPLLCITTLELLHLKPSSPAKSGTVDRERIIPFIIFIQSFCPSAMNGSMICMLYSYKAQEYSEMLAKQYLFSVFTSLCWLMFALWYFAP